MYSPSATTTVQQCPWAAKPLSCQGFSLDIQQLLKMGRQIDITIFNYQYDRNMESILCSLIGGEAQPDFGLLQRKIGNVSIQQSPQPFNMQYQITAWSTKAIASLSSKLPNKEENYTLYKSHAFFIALDMSALQDIKQ